MKRAFTLLVVLLLATTMAWAFSLQYSSGISGISVSQTLTTTTFTNNHSGGDSTAFAATWMKLSVRTGGNSCFYDPDGVATTADHILAAGEVANLTFIPSATNDAGWLGVGTICDTGETATWDISAGR